MPWDTASETMWPVTSQGYPWNQRSENVATQEQQKKSYVAPRVVDFGAIEAMTGDCFGFCIDGENGGLFGFWP